MSGVCCSRCIAKPNHLSLASVISPTRRCLAVANSYSGGVYSQGGYGLSKTAGRGGGTQMFSPTSGSRGQTYGAASGSGALVQNSGSLLCFLWIRIRGNSQLLMAVIRDRHSTPCGIVVRPGRSPRLWMGHGRVCLQTAHPP
jgi:hypothetical protein